MIRKYENPKIYLYLSIARRLAAVALFFALFFVFAVLILQKYRIFALSADLPFIVMFFLCLSGAPFMLWKTTAKRNFGAGIGIKNETKWHNDCTRLMTVIVMSFFSAFYAMIYSIVFSAFRGGYNILRPHCVAEIFIPELFVYIADGYLLCAYVLMRKEYLKNPPQYLALAMEKKRIKRALKRRIFCDFKSKNELRVYKNLMQVAGANFFIKYYYQLKNLSQEDIFAEINENYPYEEKTRRIRAEKKIFELDMADLALSELSEYFLKIGNGALAEKTRRIMRENVR